MLNVVMLSVVAPSKKVIKLAKKAIEAMCLDNKTFYSGNSAL